MLIRRGDTCLQSQHQVIVAGGAGVQGQPLLCGSCSSWNYRVLYHTQFIWYWVVREQFRQTLSTELHLQSLPTLFLQAWQLYPP